MKKIHNDTIMNEIEDAIMSCSLATETGQKLLTLISAYDQLSKLDLIYTEKESEIIDGVSRKLMTAEDNIEMAQEYFDLAIKQENQTRKEELEELCKYFELNYNELTNSYNDIQLLIEKPEDVEYITKTINFNNRIVYKSENLTIIKIEYWSREDAIYNLRNLKRYIQSNNIKLIK